MSGKRGKHRHKILGLLIMIVAVVFGSASLFVWSAKSFSWGFSSFRASVDEYEAAMNAPPDCLDEHACSEADGIPPDPKNSGSVEIPVLMFHHIRPLYPWLNSKERFYTITPERLRAQIEEALAAGYHPISLEAFNYALTTSTVRLPEKPILLTFDDGHRGHYQYVFPLLKEFQIPATFFIIVNDHVLNGYMTNDMIKEVSESGLVDIGSHTRSHVMLTQHGKLRRDQEIVGSKFDLEELLGKPVTAFAYPFGATSKIIEQEVGAAGYDLGFRIGPGTIHTEASRYGLRRIQVTQWDSIPALIKKYGSKKK